MATGSKLIMTTTKNKNAMEIGAVIETSLNNMLRLEKKKNLGSNFKPWTVDEENSNRVKVEAILSSKSFIFIFKYKGEDRQLWLHLNCDSDNSYMTDKPNVSISFNMWGNHKEILKTIQKELEKNYPKNEFFFDFNDCDDQYQKVGEGNQVFI